MNLTILILSISLVISSGWALPTSRSSDQATDVTHGASANPDDDAETVDVIPNDVTPEEPETPNTDGEPSLVLIPLQPSYGGYGGFPIQQPTFWSYFPVNPYSWNLNFFTDIFSQLRNTAASTWSHVPTLRSSFDLHPPAESDSNTTSTVKIINGRKVTINETVYTTKTIHGHSIYKVRTVDVQPLDSNDNDSPTTLPPPEIGTTDSDIEQLEPHNNNDGGNVDIDELTKLDAGSPEELDASQANDILRESDDIEVIDVERDEPKNKLQKVEPLLSWSSNEKYSIESNGHNSNDDAIENFGIDEQYAYGTEQVPVDLSNDIAVNQMLADQGAEVNPDAEVFDIHDYNIDREQARKGSAEQKLPQEQQNQAIEYLPFYHTNANKRQQIVIDDKK